MSPREVLTTLGQPGARVTNTFTYCMDAGRTARLTFGEDGTLLTWKYPKRPPA
jgi:hypothetical protein